MRSRNKTIYLKDRRRGSRRGRSQRAVWGGIIGIGTLLGLLFAFWPNAYQVSIGEVVVGTLEKAEFIDNAKQTVIAQLENKYNTGVKLENEENIKIKKVRANQKSMITPNYLVTYMRENMDFMLEFQEMSVDNKKVGIIESKEVLEELLARLTKEYIGKTDQKVEFVNKVTLKPVFAKEKDLMPIEELVTKSIQTTEQVVEYEIAPGDSLYKIANKFKISLAKLIASNEGMTEKTTLSIGQKIKVNVDVPLLSVKVIEAPPVQE